VITLADLEGRWSLERRIDDRRAGLTGRLEGTCTWRPDAAGLVQEEAGTLHYGEAPPIRAERRYLWRAEGDALAVYFEDGRAFHRLGPGRVSDRHDCAPDTYDVAYVFESVSMFSTTWRVTGPRKDMVIHSLYTRLEGPGA
jgi:hypothetical protein